MNASGFDPSLFHDDDGRKWFVNMVWDHRATMVHRAPPHDFFGGILMQEYDHAQGALVGPVHKIESGLLRQVQTQDFAAIGIIAKNNALTANGISTQGFAHTQCIEDPDAVG